MTKANKLLGGSAMGRGDETNEANTPDSILDLVRQVARIGCDPCWNPTCSTDPVVRFGIETNGLRQQWHGYGLVWVNYPFSNSAEWIPKVIDESQMATIILLTKIDTRVPWWLRLRTCPRYRARVQFDGYQRFSGAKNAATFSVALWLLAPDTALLPRFVNVMQSAGELVYPRRLLDGIVPH